VETIGLLEQPGATLFGHHRHIAWLAVALQILIIRRTSPIVPIANSRLLHGFHRDGRDRVRFRGGFPETIFRA
jgi:hypothetical protein